MHPLLNLGLTLMGKEHGQILQKLRCHFSPSWKILLLKSSVATAGTEVVVDACMCLLQEHKHLGLRIPHWSRLLEYVMISLSASTSQKKPQLHTPPTALSQRVV